VRGGVALRRGKERQRSEHRCQSPDSIPVARAHVGDLLERSGVAAPPSWSSEVEIGVGETRVDPSR